MSKERARLRARREVEVAAAQRRRERRVRRRRLLRRLVPRRPDHRTGRMFARRTRTQRGAIGAVVLMALLMVWLYGGTLATRIALSLLVAAATPVLVVLTFDRRI